MPFRGYGWKWKMGRFGFVYGTEKEVNYEDIRAKAKDLLNKVVKGNVRRCPCGTEQYPLLVDNEIVGEIWEDVDPKNLDIGTYWYGKWGIRVHLVKDGKIVGSLWLSQVSNEGDGE